MAARPHRHGGPDMLTRTRRDRDRASWRSPAVVALAALGALPASADAAVPGAPSQLYRGAAGAVAAAHDPHRSRTLVTWTQQDSGKPNRVVARLSGPGGSPVGKIGVIS